MTGLSGFFNNPNSIVFWALWGAILLWQNYAFTEVSRARSSASISRHIKAALQSNGIWFVQQLFVYTAFLKILTGSYGISKAILAALFYTFFTMSGSIYAHWRAMRKESGKTAVGASAKYAQIPVEEWKAIQEKLATLDAQVITEGLARATKLAEQAYDVTVGMIPTAERFVRGADGKPTKA